MYLVRTPFFIKKLYPSLIWNFNRKEKAIYLTFDDGPVPDITPFVLKQLEKYQAKATFFCIGDNIRKHPDIYQSILKQGHAIGNHTYNHLNGWFTDSARYVENVELCQAHTKTNLFRPPYGKLRPTQIIHLKKQYKIIMWDVLSGDFDPSLNSRDCLLNVVQKTSNGSIVVFHDSIKASQKLKQVLPTALKFWKEKGFTFKKIEI